MAWEFKEGIQFKMDVYLKSNDSGNVIVPYIKKDIPEKPFGTNFEIVSFWEEGRLMVYPFDRVDHCELYEGTEREEP